MSLHNNNEGIVNNSSEPQDTREMTFGEKAVGLAFNPSKDDKVGFVKLQYAAIIDNLHDLRSMSESPEVKRMCSVAITEAQTAQMWAVKAITWRD